jgi:hypothetical protein
MLHLRRPTVATLLVTAVVVPVLAAGPAHAAGSADSAVQPVAATWTLVRTYPDQTACVTAAPNIAAGQPFQCTPSQRVPSAYDLYVLR